MDLSEDLADLKYRTFLLRWWHTAGSPASDKSAWRFSLEEVGTSLPRHGFNNLQALMTFLETELNSDDTESGEVDDVDDEFRQI